MYIVHVYFVVMFSFHELYTFSSGMSVREVAYLQRSETEILLWKPCSKFPCANVGENCNYFKPAGLIFCVHDKLVCVISMIITCGFDYRGCKLETEL